MRNRIVASGLDREQANRVLALLLSQSIDAELGTRAGRRFEVRVDAPWDGPALALIADEYPDGLPTSQPESPIEDPSLLAPRFWFGRGAVAVVGLALLCAGIHLSVHEALEPAGRARMIEAGAIARYLVDRGEHWRFVSAVFLHFDVGHLLSNMGTLLLIGPPLAHLVGGWRFLLLFVLTGATANVFSHLLHPIAGLKAGASGGVAGVLGALGGQALRPERQRSNKRSWQVLGAMAACYAMMIGFGPGRDNYAHVGGILAGIVFGRLIPPLPFPTVPKVVVSAAALALAVGIAHAETPRGSGPLPVVGVGVGVGVGNATEDPSIPAPGTVVARGNLERYATVLGPSLQWAVARGLEMEVVETKPIPLEPARLDATQKYYAQVRLSEDKSHLVNYVAGLPFPFTTEADPDAAIKLMFNYENRIVVDDLDIRNFECDTGAISSDAGLSIERHFLIEHFRRLYYISRLYHDPKPTWPTPDGLRYREVMHPIIEPFDLAGVGITYNRYLDPYRQDDSWLYYPLLKRVRRLSSAQRSDALFGQDADIDSYGGYAGNPAWMDWRLLGTKRILASMHTRHFPARWAPDPVDFIFDDTWEMREVYVIEGTPKVPNYAYSKRIVYVDRESFVIPYTELYDREGRLWKAWLNQFKLGKKPFPEAEKVVYDYDQQFIPALSIFDMELSHATRCRLPAVAFPGEEGWYFNFGDAEGTTEEPFSISNIIASGR